MYESLVVVAVALLGGSATVVTAVLAHRSGGEDRIARRQEAEVRYLSERLDAERLRAAALEEEVRRCKARRARPSS